MTKQRLEQALAEEKARKEKQAAEEAARLEQELVAETARLEQALADERAAQAGAPAPHGHFDAFLWEFVGGRPQLNAWPDAKAVPATSEASEAMSAALKRAGLIFVGPTICYSFMQSCGLVIDHPKGTPQWEEARARNRL